MLGLTPGTFSPGEVGGGCEHPVASLEYVTLNKAVCIFVSPHFPAVNGDTVDVASVF